MTQKVVLVEVNITDKGAIYVNDKRITNRNTKWGIHNTLDRFTCPMDNVVQECMKRGHRIHVRNIEDEPYYHQKKNQ